MKKKRMIAITLTAVLVSSSLPVMAENTKQEQVYVVTDAEGTVKSITDHVRLENMDAADELVDRTVLKDIQNLGGQETCEQDGEVLTWQALGEDILYQGTSDQTPAILPVVTIVTAFFIGKDRLWGPSKWFMLIFYGVMYMLAEYATFSLSNMLFNEYSHFNSPEFGMIFAGAAMAALGIFFGILAGNASAKKAASKQQAS